MIYLWLWRRASSILRCDLPRLASAGRLYQQTRQLYVLYMLRDKIRRRGFSDKTVKDYLSFGGPVVICYQNGFCGKKEWQEWKDDGKGCRRGKGGVEAGGDWRWQKEGGVVMQGGFCFLFNFLPLSPPFPTPPYPMSWVSVTFWTCQANTVEWLELSVKVMCCLPLEELGAVGEGIGSYNRVEYIMSYGYPLNIHAGDHKR